MMAYMYYWSRLHDGACVPDHDFVWPIARRFDFVWPIAAWFDFVLLTVFSVVR